MSEDRPMTLIVSDLHVGGGRPDPGDDHVYDKAQFATFIRQQADTAEGRAGDLELIINGDFLEFAQVEPSAYSLGSAKYWCSESESLTKLRVILKGHPNIFEALKEFQKKRDGERGNRVTIAAGNHDVDFFWKDVQKEFCEKAGPVNFQLGDEWFHRYDGQLQISHGNQYDPANVFEQWANPIIDGPDGPRLEMCAGTLFMVKFVNWLENDYPFSDNIKPVTALAGILWREKKRGLFAVAWMLARFLARHPKASLSVDEIDHNAGERFVSMLKYNDEFAEGVTRLYRGVRDPQANVKQVRTALQTEDEFFDFLYEMIPKLTPEEWEPVFETAQDVTLSADSDDGVTLRIIEAGAKSDKEILRDVAGEELKREGGPRVVVMGHTHQPDKVETAGGVYFNPGSWTRYAEVNKIQNLTLEKLKCEADYPYQLNYVRVEKQADATLRAEMHCFDEEQP